MDNQMFCFQCEQTAGSKGCVKVGVCGKDPTVAALQDLLVHQLKGMGYYGQKALEQGKQLNDEITKFMSDMMFSTLTNVNFDPQRFVQYIVRSNDLKKQLITLAGNHKGQVPMGADDVAPTELADMLEAAKHIGVMADEQLDMDIRSLRELLIYGLKGMGAYAHHAHILGKNDETVNHFFFKGLAATLDDQLTVNDLIDINMELGKVNYRCMELLNHANTGAYGDPEPTEVLTTMRKGPFIVVSGHDFKDLKAILELTEGKGINVYTHGEMLPAHGYPELKKHPHLVGNFGSAWQNQQKEFDNLPGCVVMTTNCMQKPRDSYKDRLFTTSIVGWPDSPHIFEGKSKKDFSPIIQKALELGGWPQDEPEHKITVGFGHKAVLSHAPEIVAAVKAGQIKHFFLIGGCDGARPGRNYYTELAEMTPPDTIILTLACGKYRFKQKGFWNRCGSSQAP